MKRIYENLKQLVASKPEKFFMNISEYCGMRVAAFDYALTIPSDFNGDDAFECRGSVFVIDDAGEYISTLALPFEKFFNIHEYDFGNNEGLFNTVKKTFGVEVSNSDDLGKLPIKSVTVKEDGSIITSFDVDGTLRCKSNSSLTSDYAKWAEEFLAQNDVLKQKSEELTTKNWCVIYEFLIAKMPIVVQHTEDKMVVLGARNRLTGEYMAYTDLVSHFGVEYVVEEKKHTFEEIKELMSTQEGSEGFVVQTECGLRYKAKTSWYIERHNRVSYLFSTPRNIWTAYVDGTLDDCYETFKDNAINKQRLDDAVQKCDELYKTIIREAAQFKTDTDELGRVEFYKYLNEYGKRGTIERMSGLYVAALRDRDQKSALNMLKRKLLVRDIISELGILGWRV